MLDSHFNRSSNLRQPLAVVAVGVILWQTARWVFAPPAGKLPDPLALLTGFFDPTPRGVPVLLSLADGARVAWSEASLGFAKRKLFSIFALCAPSR
jgi:ABC-type nitrate/sulfonate/bicarbonate transport system permease component